MLKNVVFDIIKIGVPILLIIMGAIDLGKAVMASDDKEIKAATSKLIKRAIAAAAVFFAVTIVDVVMGLVATSPITTSTIVTAKNTAAAAIARLINLLVAALISLSSLAITAFPKSIAPIIISKIGTPILIISNTTFFNKFY